MDIKKFGNKINPKELFQKLTGALNRRRSLILIVIFLSVSGYCAYLWYRYISNPNWSESRRQEYISTKQKEAAFDKDKFDDVIKLIDERKMNYQKNLDSVPDIFRLK